MAREALETANAAVRKSLPQEKAEMAKARLSMQQSTISAQQLQVARQQQFQIEMRQWEKQQHMERTGGSRTTAPQESRFQTGYRPTQLCKKLFLHNNCIHG